MVYGLLPRKSFSHSMAVSTTISLWSAGLEICINEYMVALAAYHIQALTKGTLLCLYFGDGLCTIWMFSQLTISIQFWCTLIPIEFTINNQKQINDPEKMINFQQSWQNLLICYILLFFSMKHNLKHNWCDRPVYYLHMLGEPRPLASPPGFDRSRHTRASPEGSSH